MSNPSRSGPQDSNHVTLGQNYDVEYWSNRFGVSRDELEEAIDSVGDSVDAIAAYLNTRR